MIKLPPKILWLASFRYYLMHPWLLTLTLLGLASGVGIVIAIDIAVSSAQNQVDKTVTTLMGEATHQIIGGPEGIDQSVFVDLKVNHGIHHISPVISGYVYHNRRKPVSLNVFGVAPFNEANFRPFVSSSVSNEKTLGRFFTTPFGVLLTPETARAIGVKENDHFTVFIGTKTMSLQVIGFLPNDATLNNLIVTDIANAQSLFGLGNRITRIDLSLHDKASVKKIEQLLPDNLQLISTQSHKAGLEQLTQAFRTNLRAMSLLALLIGVFVVFTTVRFSVFNRMQQFGLYRVSGVTGGELQRLIIIEVFCLSLVASVLGLIGGALLADILIKLITQTFSDHYFALENTQLDISFITVVKALFLGICVAILTAYLPARQAARAQAVTVGERMGMELAFEKSLRNATKTGLAFGLFGIILIVLSNSLAAGFVGLFLCVLSFALIAPGLFSHLNAYLFQRHWHRLPLPVLMGLRDVKRSLSRTAVALVAMVIALSATIGVALMVGSFRLAVSDWLDNTLQADVYISLPDNLANPATQKFDPRQIAQMTRLNNVRTFSQGRHLYVNSGTHKYLLMMLDVPLQGFKGFDFLQQLPGDLYQQFQHTDTILVTEPFAYHQHITLGDSIALNTASGKHTFKVIGIYRDYASESGKITMSQSVFEKYWPAIGVTTIGLYLKDKANSQQFIQSLRGLFTQSQNISIRSSEEIRQKSLLVFDRTFLITEVLRILILAVAVITVIVSLMSWQLERRRELAVSQAIGFLPRQLQQQLYSQSVFMSLNAFIFSIPLGLFIAVVLIYIINKRSFGWSMALVMEPSQFFYAGLSALIAALIAAAYPAWQISQSSPREALQQG